VLYRRSCLEQYGYWPENAPSAADWRHWIGIIEGGQRRNLAYLPMPTCLHFSANWKKSRHSAVEEVRTWLEVSDSHSWWPPALRWPIPPGMTEQRVIAEAMRAGGTTWIHDVRAAVDVVLDRLAWDDIRAVRPQLQRREVENQHLRGQVSGLDTEIAALRDLLAAHTTQAESYKAVAETNAVELKARIAGLKTELAALHTNLAAYETLVETCKALAESNAIHADVAERELQALRRRLALTLASTSWRITAPMRMLKELFGP
jgi:hypothetical protein